MLEHSRSIRHIRRPKRTPPLGSWGSWTGPLAKQGSSMLITSPCLGISSISSYYGWFNTCSNFHSSYHLNIFPSGPLRWVCRTEVLTHLIPLYAGISIILCTGNTRSIVWVTDLAEPRVAWVRTRFQRDFSLYIICSLASFHLQILEQFARDDKFSKLVIIREFYRLTNSCAPSAIRVVW